MKAYTDYPMTHLGDKSGEQAPIREIYVHGWDGNKYVYITVEGTVTSIKYGYIYPSAARCGEVNPIHHSEHKVLSADEIDKLCEED